MIQEAYCSFEVSKLLEEKGFNESCLCVYYGEDCKPVIPHDNNFVCKCPTHQRAMAWLRQVHNIFIEIGASIDLNGNYHFSYTILDKECKYVRRGWTSFDWNYEEAVEAVLKYVLENLI